MQKLAFIRTICLVLVLDAAASVLGCPGCDVIDNGYGGDNYPLRPLTYRKLRRVIMQNQNESRLYYEIYSLDPKDPSTVPALPLLRKVVIRWNLKPTGYTNNYAGWLPSSPPMEGTCITNEIPFAMQSGKHVRFVFDTEFPVPEPHIGTLFSSNPEYYHINWYCPQSQFVRRHSGYTCLQNLRMSIYSAYGPNNLPWQDIVRDLRVNRSPPMNDPRWYMTYDAPEQCTIANSRARRDVNI